ncbi:testis-expressed protein 49-like isoform X1 [Xyrauchen texanus]|uniref:testis-expressed protein 49-like isoform X1 n=1 Tax=Xyrauchen texanus TaxID=154827 RepID=UPI00224187BE|nr:testis-expressed protein 49-like isoform X1 [Xyrauchen texanus]
MAFFGITYLGYQNPIRDRMLPSAQNKPVDRDVSRMDAVHGLPPISSHRGRTCADLCRCKFTINPTIRTHRLQLNKVRFCLIAIIAVADVKMCCAPRELYRVPLTDNQQYGWWVSTGGPQNQEPWTQNRRFPRKNSEMTKFVDEMSMTNQDFSLF